MKKRLLQIIPNYGFGGAQRVFHNLSTELSKHYDVIECAFTDDGIVYSSENQRLTLDAGGKRTVFGKYSNFRKRIGRLRQIKKQEKIDVSISHLEGANLVNVLSGGKTIITVHGSKLHDENISGFTGAIRKKVLIPRYFNKADHVVTVSQAIRMELEQMGLQNRITAIPNFFDIDSVQKLSTESLGSEEKYFKNGFTLLSSGRLSRQKNYSALLDIAARIKKRSNSIRLIILGDGEDRDSLVDRSRSLGLTTRAIWENGSYPDEFDVLFMGYQPNPFRFIAAADLFVMTSDWEGFPMALGEAMICGTPVMVTDCPTGPREILAPGSELVGRYQLQDIEITPNGILMPRVRSVENAELWARTLIDCSARTELLDALSLSARDRIEIFDKDRIITEWRTIIDRL